ncbi:MAG: hypothetical protein IJJ69_09150 [Oscillospiraceae bacterium]|nr:hypothetical protein [Ruminococcus sp.]MBR0484926.1 hypothetical protein [Oscillospiraceae bacterium]
MKINITEKLQQEKPVLEIFGKEFEIDNRKDTVLAYTEKDFSNKKTTEVMEDIIQHFAGEKALKEIQAMKDLSFHDCEIIIYGIMALALEITLEEAEQRFHSTAKSEA